MKGSRRVYKLLVMKGSRRVNKLLVMKGSRQVCKQTSLQVTCYERKLVLMLLCLSLQATCSLVHSLTCPLTLLLCLLFTLSTSNLFTCPLYIVKMRKRCLQEEGFNLKSCFYSFVLVLLWWESLNILIRRLEK